MAEVFFFAAFVAMGTYLAALAAAILNTGAFGRWIGWASAVASVLVLAGNLLSIIFDPAFLAVLLGFALFMVVLVALGVSLWRHAVAAPSPQVAAAA